MESFYNYLTTITSLSKSDFEKSAVFFRLLSLEKGEVWIQQHNICREMAYVKQGMLRSFFIDTKGNEVTSCFCEPNGMASSFKSFISQEPSHLAIQALDQTELLVISYSDLQRLYKEVPVWQEISRLLMEKEYLSLWNYAFSLNTETAMEKYHRLLYEQPDVLQKAPVQEIASYLGISRETLSRIRKKMTIDIL